jgi:EAL domain-containing protein (putative c-di-GMP-specific phosphodiesterase class I)
VAEECGLIDVIGMWVLRSACAQAAKWHREGLGLLTIAVNLSARQTRNAELAHCIRTVLEETGLEAGQLELEITESILMEKMQGSISLLAALRRSGIRLAMDDFGTGYSSFAYLKQFPLDHLKVDRTFVNDIGANGENGAIVTAIISMAHELGMLVVAEGVETAAQARFLMLAGCDVMQGYFLARPMTADVASDFLRSRQDNALGSIAVIRATGTASPV